MADSFNNTYNKKIKDLQKYVPFLEKMINRLKNNKEELRLRKMESLYFMITDKNKKYKFDILLKCEEVLEKLQNTMQPNILSAEEDKEVKDVEEPKNTDVKQLPSISKNKNEEIKKVISEKSKSVFEKKCEASKGSEYNSKDYKEDYREANKDYREAYKEDDTEANKEDYRESYEEDYRDDYEELTIAERIYSNRKERKYRPYSVAKASKQNVILPMLLEAIRAKSRNYDDIIDNRNESPDYQNYNINTEDDYYTNSNQAGCSRYNSVQFENRNYNRNNFYDRKKHWNNDLEKFNFFDEAQERQESESMAEYYVRQKRYSEKNPQDDPKFDRSRSRSSSSRRESNFSNNDDDKDVSKTSANLVEENRFSNRITAVKAEEIVRNTKDNTPEPIRYNPNEIKIEPQPEVINAEKTNIIQEQKDRDILCTNDIVKNDVKGLKFEKNFISHNKNDTEEPKANDNTNTINQQKSNNLQHESDNCNEVVGAYSKYDKMYANLLKPGVFTSPLESLYGEDNTPKHFRIPKRQKPKFPTVPKVESKKEELVVSKASKICAKQPTLETNEVENKFKTYNKKVKIKEIETSRTEKTEICSNDTVVKVKNKKCIKVIKSDDEEIPVKKLPKKTEKQIKSKKSVMHKNKKSLLQESDIAEGVNDTIADSKSNLVVEKPQIDLDQEVLSNNESLVIDTLLSQINKNQEKKLKNIPKEQKLKNIPKEDKLKNISKEEKIDNIPKGEKLKKIPKEEKLENIPKEEKLENIPREKLKKIPKKEKLENIPIEEKLKNIPKGEKLKKIPKKEKLKNIPKEEKLENIPKEQIQISNNENLRNVNKELIKTVVENAPKADIAEVIEQNKKLIPELKEQAKELIVEKVKSSSPDGVLEFILKNFKHLKKMFESDSSSDDERTSRRKKRKKKKRKKRYSSSSSTSSSSDDEKVKRRKSNKTETEDHKESNKIKVPDEKLAEIEIKENIVESVVKENIIESPKELETDSINNGKESVGNVNVSSKDTIVSKSSSTKSKISIEHQKPRRSELDILHEDIKEMWLGRDIMRASGKRTCTYTKEEAKNLAKKQCLPPSHDEFIAKALKLRVLISRRDITNYFEKSATSSTVTLNTIRKSSRLKPMPLSKQKEALRKTETLNKKNESPQKTDSSLHTSETSLNPPTKRRKASAKAKELSVEKDSADEFHPRTDILPGLKRSFKYHDKNYFVKGDKTSCLLCSFKGKQITPHYKIKHKGSEVLISRIDPTIIQSLIQDSKANCYQSLNLKDGPKEKYPYICPFCPANLTVDFAANFYDHITSHTGEYRFRCSECTYEWHNQSGLTHHGAKHIEKKKLAPRPPPPNSNDVFGYVCNECYYVQTLEENMKKHVRVYHEDNTEIIKINLNLVGLNEQTEQRTEYVAPETLIDENHDSNEPFLTPDSFLELKIDDSDNKTLQNEVIEEEIKVEDNQIQAGTTDKKEDDSKSSVEDAEKTNNESLTAFTCENHIEDKIAEEKRVQKMNEILENVIIQRTSIADKIQSKLKAKITDVMLSKQASTQLHENTSNTVPILSTSIPKINLEAPEILNKSRPININKELFKWTPPQPKLKIHTPSKHIADNASQEEITRKNIASRESASIAQSNNTIATEAVSQQKHAPIYSIINRLQGKLQSHTADKINNFLPPLIHYKELAVQDEENTNITSQNNVIPYKSSQDTQESLDAILLKQVDNSLPTLSHYKNLSTKEKPEVILHAGSIKLLRRQNGSTIIACFVPHCIFCTDNPKAFEAHCKVTHFNVQFDSWLCNRCNRKFGMDGKMSTLTDIFFHICNVHSNCFRKHTTDSQDSKKTITIENILGDAEDIDNSLNKYSNTQNNSLDPNYKFVITSIKSMVKKSEQSSTPSSPILSSISTMTGKSSLALPSTLDTPSTLEAPALDIALESLLDTPLQLLTDLDINSMNIEPSAPKEAATRKDFIRPVPLFKLLAAESEDQSDKEDATPEETPDNNLVHAEPYRKTPYAANCLLDPAKIAHFYKCPCYDCTFSTFLRFEFMKHIDVHADTRIYCLYCDTIMYMSWYVSHLEKFHIHCRFSCSHCFYRASNMTFVRVHIEMAHKNVNKVMIVATPEETMPKLTIKKSDELPPIKSLVRPYVCGANDCNMKTISIDMFLDHYKMHADKKERLVCGYCTDILVKETILPHFSSSHSVYPYHCRYCSNGASNLTTVIQHQAIAHKTLPFSAIIRKLRLQDKKKCSTNYHEEYKHLFIYTDNYLDTKTRLSPEPDTNEDDFLKNKPDIAPPEIRLTSPQIELISFEEPIILPEIDKYTDEEEFDHLSILHIETQLNCELCLQEFDSEHDLNQHKCTKKKVKLKAKTNELNKMMHKLNARTTVVERRKFNSFNDSNRRGAELVDGTLYPTCNICGLLTGLLQTCDHLVPHIYPNEHGTPLVGKVRARINQDSSSNKVDGGRNMILTVEASIIPSYVRQNRWECGGKNCRRLWQDKDKLKHHVGIVHFEETTYTCHHCNVTLDFGSLRIQRDIVIKHLLLHGPTLYGCDYCPYLDNEKYFIEAHVIKVHVGKGKAYCVHREFNQKTAVLEEKKKSLLKRTSVKTYTTKPNNIKILNKDARNVLLKNTIKSSVTEDSVTEDSVTEDSVTEDSVTKDGVTKDAVTKDAVTKDAVTKDAVTKDAVTKDAVINDITNPIIIIDSSDDESTVEITNSDIIDRIIDRSTKENGVISSETDDTSNDTVIIRNGSVTENVDDDYEMFILEEDQTSNTQEKVANTQTSRVHLSFVKPNGPHYQPTLDTFKCPLCKYFTIFPEEFVNHLSKKEDAIRAYLKSKRCNENITDWIHSLLVYQAKILFFWRDTNTSLEKSCRFCPVVCDKKIIFNHEVKHLNYTVKPFQCYKCSYSSFSKESLEIHISMIHRGSAINILKELKANVYPIKSVNSTSTNDIYLLKVTALSDFEHNVDLLDAEDMECHWYTVKSANYIYTCSMCCELFSTIFHFDEHNTTKHKKAAKHLLEKKSKCRLCDALVDTDQQLRHHIKTHFNLYKCKHCSFTAYNVRLLRKHYFDDHPKNKFEFLYDFVGESDLVIALGEKRLYL